MALGAFDANGVKLGDNEAAVKKVFPGIRCKPLEWKSDAADRRCERARLMSATELFDSIRFFTEDLWTQAGWLACWDTGPWINCG